MTCMKILQAQIFSKITLAKINPSVLRLSYQSENYKSIFLNDYLLAFFPGC